MNDPQLVAQLVELGRRLKALRGALQACLYAQCTLSGTGSRVQNDEQVG